MNWLSDLRRDVPDMTLAAHKASKAPLHPRDVLLKSVEDSLKFLKDPKYTVLVKGKPQEPKPCYSIKNGKAVVTLKYFRSKLTLDGANTDIMVPEANLELVLDRLKPVITSEVFDAQLDKIKAARMAALKAGTERAKDAKATEKATDAKKAA